MGTFAGIHEASWLGLLVILAALLLALSMSPLFRDRVAGRPLPSSSAGRGWVRLRPALTHLVIYSGLFIFVVAGAMFWLGRLTPADVGLVWSRLPDGFAYLLVMWAEMQLLGLLIGLYVRGKVILYGIWRTSSTFVMLANIIAYSISVAAVSEVIFRGFLIPQVLYKIQDLAGIPAGWTLVLALVVAQLLVAAFHLPRLFHLQTPRKPMTKQLAVLFVWGVLLALVYVRTGNLFVCMGVHTLTQQPAPLFKSASMRVAGGDRFQIFLLLLVAATMLLAWPALPHIVG